MPISALEAAHRAASDLEMVAWVDPQDRLLGGLPRQQLREQGLIGRGTFILLFNSAGELCVHQRTLSKALYPGFWDVAAGGMVGVDESYAESAARELAEELGVLVSDIVSSCFVLSCEFVSVSLTCPLEQPESRVVALIASAPIPPIFKKSRLEKIFSFIFKLLN